jgi:hypothetical protein
LDIGTCQRLCGWQFIAGSIWFAFTLCSRAGFLFYTKYLFAASINVVVAGEPGQELQGMTFCGAIAVHSG